MHSSIVRRLGALAPMLIAIASCSERPPASAAALPDTAGMRHAVAAGIAAAADTDTVHTRADSLRRADSLSRLGADRLSRDTLQNDSTAKGDSVGPAGKRRARRVPADSVVWPTNLPAPLPGSLLPGHMIVAFYGNPLSKRMGILGELPPAEMMAKLERTAAEWQRADTVRKVMPALHLIATVAQASAGRDGKYRLRMSDSLIERVAGWAESKGWLLFLDIQVGQSTVHAELPRLMPYLRRPYVHLALDPEFAMKNGARPGKRIGTMDAVEINEAIDSLISVVDANQLPPKILLVHRFTTKMLTNASKIRKDARAQVVIDMDGFGTPQLKRGTWQAVILRDPVWFTGFKLFYKNDKPMLTPSQVLAIKPKPVYVQYQ